MDVVADPMDRPPATLGVIVGTPREWLPMLDATALLPGEANGRIARARLNETDRGRCAPLGVGYTDCCRRYWSDSEPSRVPMTLSFDFAAAPDATLRICARYLGSLRFFETPIDALQRRSMSTWTRVDELRWPGDEPFRLFTTCGRYWFLDELGHLVWTPREGEEGREVTAAWAADTEHPVLATILDQDHQRGLVFCRGQYLELTDELRIIPEPVTGWPQPDPSAEPLDQLLTYLKWLPPEP